MRVRYVDTEFVSIGGHGGEALFDARAWRVGQSKTWRKNQDE